MKKIFLFTLSFIFALNGFALTGTYNKPQRHYCDTSAGRTVLDSGKFSQSYCRETAVMLIRSSKACCTWDGGILKEVRGQVICRNGTISPICSIQGINKFKKSPIAKLLAG